MTSPMFTEIYYLVVLMIFEGPETISDRLLAILSFIFGYFNFSFKETTIRHLTILRN
jgi:hypothetical protein